MFETFSSIPPYPQKTLIPESEQINAYNKDVIVIGGGDTGSDCVGSANRQGAKKVTQLELMPQPPEKRSEHEPWPLWPKLHKVSSSHEEGCERKWNILTTEFTGENGHVKKLNAKKVVWFQDKSGNYQMSDVANSEFELKADLVLLAMGFTHPEHKGVVTDLGIELTERGNIKVDEKFMTSKEGVFAAGDAQRGASLVVYAVCEGRAAANGIDEYLMKS